MSKEFTTTQRLVLGTSKPLCSSPLPKPPAQESGEVFVARCLVVAAPAAPSSQSDGSLQAVRGGHEGAPLSSVNSGRLPPPLPAGGATMTGWTPALPVRVAPMTRVEQRPGAGASGTEPSTEQPAALGTNFQSELPGPGASPYAEARRTLFRDAALEARYFEATDLQALAMPQPWAWSVLALLVSVVVTLFGGAALARVEVTAEALGALRGPSGLWPVTSPLGGAIAQVLVQPGESVTEGQKLVEIEGVELRAALLKRQRELESTQQDFAREELADRQSVEQATGALEQRRKALQGRLQLKGAQRAQRRSRDRSLQELAIEGAASGDERLAGKEALQAATDALFALRSDLALLNLEISDRTRALAERARARSLGLERARASVEEAESLLTLTSVRSPALGKIESLLVTPGSSVEPGALIAHVVPVGSLRSIVAFVRSDEVAFVSHGAEAVVEFPALPISEFGTTRARVTRISTDVATAMEMGKELGEVLVGSFVRVELELMDTKEREKMALHLRSGDRVLVRLHRREPRVISLLFDFLRKWLE